MQNATKPTANDLLAIISRGVLVSALIANGWKLDADGDYVKVNSYLSLNPSGADDDTAVVGEMGTRNRRALSYSAARLWATDIAAFELTVRV